MRKLMTWKNLGVLSQFLFGGGVIYTFADTYTKLEELSVEQERLAIEKQRFSIDKFVSQIKIAERICSYEGSIKSRVEALNELSDFSLKIDAKFCFKYTGKPSFSWDEMISPTNGRFVRGFGCYKHPVMRKSRFFAGINISNKEGTDIRATLGGIVVAKLNQGGLGQHIIIDHGEGWRSYYGHLSSFAIDIGDHVEIGQKIGEMGRTGRATGSVLTFMVSRHGVFYDPRGKGTKNTENTKCDELFSHGS